MAAVAMAVSLKFVDFCAINGLFEAYLCLWVLSNYCGYYIKGLQVDLYRQNEVLCAQFGVS